MTHGALAAHLNRAVPSFNCMSPGLSVCAPRKKRVTSRAAGGRAWTLHLNVRFSRTLPFIFSVSIAIVPTSLLVCTFPARRRAATYNESM